MCRSSSLSRPALSKSRAMHCLSNSRQGDLPSACCISRVLSCLRMGVHFTHSQVITLRHIAFIAPHGPGLLQCRMPVRTWTLCIAWWILCSQTTKSRTEIADAIRSHVHVKSEFASTLSPTIPRTCNTEVLTWGKQELVNDPLRILQPSSKLQHALPLASAYAAVAAQRDADPRQRRRMDLKLQEPKVCCMRDCIAQGGSQCFHQLINACHAGAW